MKTCNICNKKIKIFFNKKNQPEIIYPIKKRFKKILKNFYRSDLIIGKCNYCQYLQTINKIGKKKLLHMYETEQSFSTSILENPKLMGDIEQEAFEYIKKFLKVKKLNNLSMCEIGGFDGWLIKKLNSFFKKKLLIEPNLRGCQIAKKNKIKTINSFFNKNLANKNQDKFDLVVTRHVIEHVPNLKNFVENISKIIKKNGYLIVETPCLDKILELGKTRVFIHQHLHYFSLYAQRKIFSNLKLIKQNIINESTMITVFKKTPPTKKIKLTNSLNKKFINFKYQIDKKRERLNSVLRNNNNKIFVYGASSQINDLITLYELNQKKINAIIDSNLKKKNYFLPSAPNLKISHLNKKKIDKKDLIIIATASKKKVKNILDKFGHSGERFLL